MKRMIACAIIIAFLSGVTLTAVVTTIALRQDPARVVAAVGAKLPTPALATSLPLNDEEKNFSSFDKSFGLVVDDLGKKQGKQADEAALRDLISIDLNTIALLRRVSASTTQPDLKDFAQKAQAQRQAEATQLSNWQTEWGTGYH